MKSPHFLTEQELTTLITSKYQEEVLGWCGECVVVPVHGKESLASAYIYKPYSPVEARGIFYVQRVLSTLFPHNFPKFYAAFGAEMPPDLKERTSSHRPTGTIRQRIIGETMKPPKNVEEQESFIPPYSRSVDHPFSRVTQEMQKVGLQLQFDMYEPNFMLGTDGGEYYVDQTGSNAEDIVENKGEILRYMAEHDYSKDATRLVRLAIDRLVVLRNQ